MRRPALTAKFAEIAEGQGPVAASAIHNGHELRDEVEEIMALSASERLREEDPHTGIWTSVAATQLIAHRSRFEVDLNRPRDNAVYRSPEDAWGLQVWKREPSAALLESSLAEYDAFYSEAHRIFSEMEKRFGHFVVLDLHSYNHRRQGPGEPLDDAASNPEVNVGTGTLDRNRWGLLIERFIGDLTAFEFLGRHLDVRENVKFRGGRFPRWIHETFPDSACCLAVEVKKFFMDEWTGKIAAEEFEAVPRALEATLPGLLESLEKVGGRT
jgi:N-formylglutamate deformylase